MEELKEEFGRAGDGAGTIQENGKATDCPGNNFLREKSKENVPIRAGLRDTSGKKECLRN